MFEVTFIIIYTSNIMCLKLPLQKLTMVLQQYKCNNHVLAGVLITICISTVLLISWLNYSKTTICVYHSFTIVAEPKHG